MISHRDRRDYALYCLGRAQGTIYFAEKGHFEAGAFMAVGERGVERLLDHLGRLEREIGETRAVPGS